MAKKSPLKTILPIGLAIGAGVAGYFLFFSDAKASEPTQPGLPPKPAPKPGPRPSGDPPPFGRSCFPPEFGGSNRYDTLYWEEGGTARARERIFEGFEALGYETPDDRDTMNKLGPDGKLGGGDDVANPEVRRFQQDYNAVSRGKKFAPNMGGLDTDGKVGPCTLNALKFVIDNLEPDEEWADIVAEA